MNFLGWLIDFALKLLGLQKAKDPAVITAQIANAEGEISATTTRQTATQTQKALSDVQTQTDASVAAVHDADGLRGQSDAVQAAIDRANAAPGAN